jgi:hypothetical protein
MSLDDGVGSKTLEPQANPSVPDAACYEALAPEKPAVVLQHDSCFSGEPGH